MKHKIQILQNKTIRLALDLSPWTHLDITHFLKMQWLPVDVRVEQLNLNQLCDNVMTKSVCCGHEKMFLIYNLFYINFLQVFSIIFFCKPFQSPSGLLFGDHYGNKGHQTLYSVFFPW